MGKSAEVAMY